MKTNTPKKANAIASASVDTPDVHVTAVTQAAEIPDPPLFAEFKTMPGGDLVWWDGKYDDQVGGWLGRLPTKIPLDSLSYRLGLPRNVWIHFNTSKRLSPLLSAYIAEIKINRRANRAPIDDAESREIAHSRENRAHIKRVRLEALKSAKAGDLRALSAFVSNYESYVANSPYLSGKIAVLRRQVHAQHVKALRAEVLKEVPTKVDVCAHCAQFRPLAEMLYGARTEDFNSEGDTDLAPERVAVCSACTTPAFLVRSFPLLYAGYGYDEGRYTPEVLARMGIPTQQATPPESCGDRGRRVAIRCLTGGLAYVADMEIYSTTVFARSRYFFSRRSGGWFSTEEEAEEHDPEFAAGRKRFLQGVIGNYHSSRQFLKGFKLKEDAVRVINGVAHGDKLSRENTIGIELEVQARRRSLDTTLKAKQVLKAIRDISDPTFVGAEVDGSVASGFELVFAWTTLDQWGEIVPKMFADPLVWKGLASHDSPACGLHVNMEVYGVASRAAITKFINDPANEAVIMAIARRYNASYSLIRHGIWTPQTDHYASASFDNTNGGDNRLMSLRIFRGTLNWRTLLARIQFAHLLVSAADHFTRPLGDWAGWRNKPADSIPEELQGFTARYVAAFALKNIDKYRMFVDHMMPRDGSDSSMFPPNLVDELCQENPSLMLCDQLGRFYRASGVQSKTSVVEAEKTNPIRAPINDSELATADN